MQIIVSNNNLLRLTQVYEPQEAVITKHFRAKDPNAHYKKAMTNTSWDGYTRFYNEKAQTIKKAFLSELVELCDKNNFPYDIVDDRYKSKYPLPSPDSFDVNLIDGIKAYPWQMRCWQSACEGGTDILKEIGTHFHPTGSGKSIMMAGLVKLFRCPTVIITEQSIVLDQIVKTLRINKVVHHNDVGEFYSGKMPSGNLVCVGSIAAIQSPKKPKYDNFKVKLPTIKSNFKKMLKKDPSKLQKLISLKGVFAWIRSNMIEELSDGWEKGEVDIEINEWDDYEIHKILMGFSDDNLKSVLGDKNYKIWHQTRLIGNCFEDELTKAFLRLEQYLKDKYYEAAVKSYGTLKNKVKELHKMVKECELLIIDEMDNASSKLYKPLFDRLFKGRYIHGFSGTPYDIDTPVENMRVKSRFGPVISHSTRKEVEKAGQIIPIKFYMLQFGEYNQKDKTAFDIAEKEIIVNNPKFHDKLKQIVINWPKEKHLIIIDTSNIETLGKTLEDKIPNSAFIYGKVRPKKRTEIINKFEEGEINVLIVSKIGKRGMDLGGGAHNVYLIGGGKKSSNFDQMIGRSVRKNDRGWARVYDFYFTGNFYLLKHSRKHLRYVNEMGYAAFIVFGNKMCKKVNDFVKSRYRLPKFLTNKC